MNSISYLKAMYLERNRERFPSLPDAARVAPRYSDKTANGLTKCIIDFLRLKGHQAERVAVTGRYIDQSKVVQDVAGFKRRIGSGKWIPGSMQPGTADVSATINGRSVKIEVKIRDKQSQVQRDYQNQVEAAGGAYVISTSFDQFLSWYESFIPVVRVMQYNHER